MIWLLPILAYLIGSISSAVVVSRLLGMPDPRTVGSGNPGATNILRQGSKAAAAATLLGDALKGVMPVVLARLLTADPLVLSLVALAAFVGHLFPVFFGFQGGKGVATMLGVNWALSPWLGLAVTLTWLLTAAAFRYSSLAALAATLLLPVYAWYFLRAPPYLYMSLAIATLLIWRHRRNIRNLLAGKEDKIRLKKVKGEG
jgi:glycerol-3-phosphate acyltransferase PlsY